MRHVQKNRTNGRERIAAAGRRSILLFISIWDGKIYNDIRRTCMYATRVRRGKIQ